MSIYGKLIFEFIDDARHVFIWTISEITIVFLEVIKSKGMKCFKPYFIYIHIQYNRRQIFM